MDTRDVEASLKKAQAQVEEAKRSLDEAHANVAQQQTEVVFAQQEFDRTKALVERGFATYELLDQRQQTLNGANDAFKRGPTTAWGKPSGHAMHPRMMSNFIK